MTKPKPKVTTLQVETDKRSITVKDQDLSDALAAFAAKLAETRSPEQVSRQLKKLVQFGLYDSEKTVELKSQPEPVAEPESTEPEAETPAEDASTERHLAAV
jgi:hypothetical protein